MIQLNCTNCKSLLQIDDAFAGGVCRCRYCGTIQTVPKRLKKTSVESDSGAGQVEASANGGTTTSSSKTLFSKKSAVETASSGTGLDDLASIVASSGLTSSRLKKTPPPPAPEAPAVPWDRRTVLLLSSAGGVIALLLIVIVVMAFRDRSGGMVALGTDQGSGQPSAVSGGNPSTPPPTPLPASTSPNFLGQPIDAQTVAYVLDRGGYSHDLRRLDLLKAALVNSVKSLGPNRRFQVVFWGISNDPPLSYPPDGPRQADAAAISALQTFLDEQVYPVGSTQEAAALNVALKSRPQAVMFVPIRGLAEEQHTLVSRALRERDGEKSQARFDCFTLAQPEWSQGMQELAGKTGGKYRDVPLDELNKFANP